jgi:hypothetical protein
MQEIYNAMVSGKDECKDKFLDVIDLINVLNLGELDVRGEEG